MDEGAELLSPLKLLLRMYAKRGSLRGSCASAVCQLMPAIRLSEQLQVQNLKVHAIQVLSLNSIESLVSYNIAQYSISSTLGLPLAKMHQRTTFQQNSCQSEIL